MRITTEMGPCACGFGMMRKGGVGLGIRYRDSVGNPGIFSVWLWKFTTTSWAEREYRKGRKNLGFWLVAAGRILIRLPEDGWENNGL